MIAVFVLLLLMILDTVMIVLGIICCEYISVMFYSASMLVAVWGLCRKIRIYIKIKQLFDVRCRCAFASLMSAPLKCEDFAGERSGEKLSKRRESGEKRGMEGACKRSGKDSKRKKGSDETNARKTFGCSHKHYRPA